MIRRFFTKNLDLKFLALVIGLAIFYSSEREETAERTLQVDMMTIGEESLGDLVRISRLPPKIDIAVRGPEGVVAGLRADQIGPVALPMREAVARGRVELRREMFNLPDNVRLLWASPEVLEFRFERREEKVVPVIADLGPTDPDVAIDPVGTGVEPAEVRLSGPKSLVDATDEVFTEPIDIAGRASGSLVRDARLRLPKAEGLEAQAQTVRVQVVLQPDVVEVERDGIRVEIVRGTDLDPEGTLVYGAAALRASVHIRGLRSVITRLDNAEIRLFIRVSPDAFADGDDDGVLEADLPIEFEGRSEGWSVVSIVPASVPMTWLPPPPPPPPVEESAEGGEGEASSGREASGGASPPRAAPPGRAGFVEAP